MKFYNLTALALMFVVGNTERILAVAGHLLRSSIFQSGRLLYYCMHTHNTSNRKGENNRSILWFRFGSVTFSLLQKIFIKIDICKANGNRQNLIHPLSKKSKS